MDAVLRLLVAGTSIGVLYALLASAFALVYKASHTINLALGAFLLVGGYAAYEVGVGGLGLPFVVAVLAALAVVAVLAWVAQATIARPLIGAPPDAIIIATVGLDLAARAVLGSHDYWNLNRLEVGSPWQVPTRLLGVSVAESDLWIIGIGAVVVGALGAVVIRTQWGLTMRACAADQEVARAQGISVTRNLATAWVIAAVLAALVGVLVGTFPRTLDLSNYSWALRALPAVVIGGMGSLRGAVLGGLLVGYAEVLAAAYSPAALGSNFQLVFPFVIMFAVLLVRPQGLLGQREVARV